MRSAADRANYTLIQKADDSLPMSHSSPTSNVSDNSDGCELACTERTNSADSNEPPSKAVGKQFTSQVVLQVLSVSLLAVHKVASNALIPVFLTFPRPQDLTRSLRGLSII